MGKITEHLQSLIEKQLKDHGVVVWYDPEEIFAAFVETITIPQVKMFILRDRYFRLRNEVDPFLEFVSNQGQPDPHGHVPPQLLIYVPQNRQNTQHALVELEVAGTVMEPGANPWQRNTRLRVIAEQVFRKIAPEQAAGICKQVEDGLLTFEELDSLSTAVEAIKAGVIKLIFGKTSLAKLVD